MSASFNMNSTPSSNRTHESQNGLAEVGHVEYGCFNIGVMNMFLLLPTCGVLLLAGLARGEELVASKLESIPSHIGCECELVFVVALGAFQNQGKYDLSSNPDMTVSELIRLAGGHTSQKVVPKIQIIRKTPQGNKRILVNAKAILIHERSEYDLFLRRDDFVIVE